MWNPNARGLPPRSVARSTRSERRMLGRQERGADDRPSTRYQDRPSRHSEPARLRPQPRHISRQRQAWDLRRRLPNRCFGRVVERWFPSTLPLGSRVRRRTRRGALPGSWPDPYWPRAAHDSTGESEEPDYVAVALKARFSSRAVVGDGVSHVKQLGPSRRSPSQGRQRSGRRDLVSLQVLIRNSLTERAAAGWVLRRASGVGISALVRGFKVESGDEAFCGNELIQGAASRGEVA